MERIILPVPGDFMIPKLVNCFWDRIVSWKLRRESPVRVVIPMAPWEVWVSTWVAGVAIYRPSKTPLTAAKSSVYFWAFSNSSGSVGSIRRLRTSLLRAKAVIYSSAESTYSSMIAALDSTASVIWLVISFLTMEAVLVDTMIQSSSIPIRVMAVMIIPMRAASFLFTRNFIKAPPKKKVLGLLNAAACTPKG